MIREMVIKDSKKCAKLHYDYIENSMLSQLGLFFLEQIYEEIARSKYCRGYVYVENDEVAGFIIGSQDMNSFFRSLIIKKIFTLGIPILFRVITNPRLFKNVIETLFYAKKSDIDNVEAELVSIAVHEDYRRQGIARDLFNKLVDFFKQSDIHSFKVMVDKNNPMANKFYIDRGFDYIRTFSMYNKDFNLYKYHLDNRK